MTIRSTLAVVVISCWISASAHAGGDVAAGKTKALACQACHVSDDAAASAPHLVGQRAQYLTAQLGAFKRADRKHELMNAIAGQLSDADIADLAAYWSSQAAGSDTKPSPEVQAIRRPRMPFPAAFPKGFVAYHTENNPEQKRVAKSYVNEVGLAAARANQPLPNGTVILVVNYAAKLDAASQPIVGKDGGWVIDKPVSYSGMEARSGWGKDIPELLRNGDWSYNLFTADKTPRPELSQAVCLACHKPRAAGSFVFGLDQIKSAH